MGGAAVGCDPREANHWARLLEGIRRAMAHSEGNGGRRAVITLLSQLESVQRDLLLLPAEQRGKDCFELLLRSLGEYLGASLDKGLEISLSLAIGRTYDVLGDWDSAIKHFRITLGLCEEVRDLETKAEVLRQMGNVRRRQGDWDEALQCHRLGLELQERKVHSARGIAYAWDGIATVHYQRGDWEEAEKYYGMAREVAEREREDRLLALILLNLGALRARRGDQHGALALYQESLPRYEKLGDCRGCAQVYHRMGLSYAELRDWERALECYEVGLELAREAGDPNLALEAHLSKAEFYIQSHDLEMATAYCQRALQAYIELGNGPGVAESLRLLGTIFARRGEWVLAEKYLRESLAELSARHDRLGIAGVHRELGRMFRDRRMLTEAREDLSRALEIFRGARADGVAAEVEREIQELQVAEPSRS